MNSSKLTNVILLIITVCLIIIITQNFKVQKVDIAEISYTNKPHLRLLKPGSFPVHIVDK